MALARYRVRPKINPGRKDVALGSGASTDDRLWLGTLAESGAVGASKIQLLTSKEQVIAVVGKRGSGKSFTLGTIVEGLTCRGRSTLSVQEKPRAVLLFDPLDIYWPTRFPVEPSTNSEVQRHFTLAKTAKIDGNECDVEAWVPGEQHRRETDPDWFQTLQLSVPGTGLDEWGLLLGVDMMSDPMGQTFADAWRLVTTEGYRVGQRRIEKSEEFDLEDLGRALQADELEDVHDATRKALKQRLSAMHGTDLFTKRGTGIRDLLKAGRASVILLSRLNESYRAAVVSILTRMLISERQAVSFAEKRLALDSSVTPKVRRRLETAVRNGVPRTVVVLDEAQTFLAPGPRTPVRSLFTQLVKEGRNMGLSAVIATQQPSAIDKAVLSQVVTFIAHQLVTESDIRAVRENLKSELPEKISYGPDSWEKIDPLLRMLPPGYCVVSSSDIDTTPRRAIVVTVRPRATVHGGIEL
jgi:hypothetical protein